MNPDRRASNLEVMPEDVLALWRGRPAQPDDGTRTASAPALDQKKPYPLWWYVLALALAAALLESWLASRYLGVQQAES